MIGLAARGLSLNRENSLKKRGKGHFAVRDSDGIAFFFEAWPTVLTRWQAYRIG